MQRRARGWVRGGEESFQKAQANRLPREDDSG